MFHALVRWVEQGIAPDRIIATKYINDNPAQGVQRTRPLCAYPKVARWTGQGSSDSASNFACVDTVHDDEDVKVTGPR
jgi:feruloyl esterase